MSEPVMPLMLKGGPRDGRVISRIDGANFIHVPTISLDGCSMHTDVYDGNTGEWLRAEAPTSMPPPARIELAFDHDAERGWFARLRLSLALRIGGGTVVDRRDDW